MVVRPKTLAAAVLASLALAACGNADEVPGEEEPAREGLSVPLEGVEYNVFITRQLNPALPPDQAYVQGEDAETEPDEALFGVFLQVCNPSDDESLSPTDEFTVTDNQGNEFEPEELPEDNAFAYHPRTLGPKECIPRPGSVAQLGPTAGSMLLFRLPLQATENRPLELEIVSAEESRRLELDL